jgi:hypothetical protein
MCILCSVRSTWKGKERQYIPQWQGGKERRYTNCERSRIEYLERKGEIGKERRDNIYIPQW